MYGDFCFTFYMVGESMFYRDFYFYGLAVKNELFSCFILYLANIYAIYYLVSVWYLKIYDCIFLYS